VITSTATHAFFPLMDRNWAALRAQVQHGGGALRKALRPSQRGMWLGECG